MAERKWTGVVMLHNPLMDKVAALALVERTQGDASLPIVAFWSNPECPDEQLKAWRSGGIFPIDLGQEKYHKAGVGSATEFVARALGIEGEPVVRELVRLANENNRTGNLKAQKFLAPAWLIREMYDADYDQREVVERTSHVVKMFMAAWGSKPVTDSDAEVKSLREEFGGALLDTVNLQFAPLTLSRYLRDMWRMGVPPEEIRSRMEWWLDASDTIAFATEEAEDTVGNIERHPFSANGWRGLAIMTVNRLVTKAISRTCDILVTEHPERGHVAILAKEADLKSLAAVLGRLEPGLWHLTQGALVNGGLVYVKQRATAYHGERRHDLLCLIQAHVPKRQFRRNKFARR